MNNSFVTLLVTILIVLVMLVFTFFATDYNYVTIENERLTQRVDSLMNECYKKDVSIDEATSIALSLSERVGKLYEIDSVTHKKLFSETD